MRLPYRSAGRARMVVEVKSIDAVAPIREAQVIWYLKLSGCKLGLLIIRRPATEAGYSLFREWFVLRRTKEGLPQRTQDPRRSGRATRTSTCEREPLDSQNGEAHNSTLRSLRSLWWDLLVLGISWQIRFPSRDLPVLILGTVKGLRLYDCPAGVMGSMIGSGILSSPLTLRASASPGLLLLCWLVERSNGLRRR